MSGTWKDRIRPILFKIAIALGIAFLAGLLSLFPALAIHGDAKVNIIDYNWQLYYVDSEVKGNMTYNPFLFSFFWLTGRGQLSYSFAMRSLPRGANQGMVSFPMADEIKEDALIIIALNAIFANAPYNFIIVLAIEFLKVRRFYFCLLGGVIGFPLGGIIGAIISFVTSLFLVVLFVPKLVRSRYIMSLRDSRSRREERLPN